MDRSGPLEQAVTRLQRRHRYLRRVRRSLDTALAGLAAACLATALVTAGVWTLPLPVVYAVLALATLGVILCLSWPGRGSPLDILAAADRTLRSRERLSTAYEYGQQHADHPFNAALMDEADRLAPRVEPRQVMPLHLPRRLWAIPALLLATFTLHWIEAPTWSFDTLGDADVSRQAVREGQRLNSGATSWSGSPDRITWTAASSWRASCRTSASTCRTSKRRRMPSRTVSPPCRITCGACARNCASAP